MINRFFVLWEVPLAILSFFFYKVVKFFIGILYTIYLAVNRKNASRWRVLSAENLQSPLSLPVLMTKGPRWNTHAIIGTIGPFAVKDAIAIDTDSANRSAGSWIAVIYGFPSYETIASLESDKIQDCDRWVSVPLKPGKYSIGLRYYHWSDEIDLPAIRVDGSEFVGATSVAADTNDFYRDLIQYKNWFYLALHYYIFTILRLHKWLPQSWVRSEYLPVGAPDTEFLYGYLIKGQSLQIEIAPSIVKNCDIYLTVYDRSSLPLFWNRIDTEKHITQPIESNGYYLFRIRVKPTLSEALGQNVASKLEDEDGLVQRLQIF